MKFIGAYQVRGLLGRGGMGKVYLVASPHRSGLWALKLLEPNPFLVEVWGEALVRRHFAREAQALAELSHPRLVRVVDQGEEAGRPFYVMEHFCRSLGGEIGEGARVEDPSRPLDPAQALAYLAQTLAGVAALHRAGLVHRDLKPHNLMLDRAGGVRVSDLGLSLLRGERDATPRSLKVGSPFYAAPEQEAQPDTAGPATDFFSLGATLFRLVTGVLPEPGGPPASSLNPHLDAAWDRFLDRALQPDPGARYADAGEMLAALRELAQGWEQTWERTCRLAAPPPRPRETSPAPVRARPAKVSQGQAPAAFGLDPLGRPRHYAAPAWQRRGQVVEDPGRGLTWQWSGAGQGLGWAEAFAEAERANQAAWAGRRDWRLPTVAELLTLLAPPYPGRRCGAPRFDPAVGAVWSADARSFTSAWVVSLEAGFVGWRHRSCLVEVKLVAGGEPGAGAAIS
ncbi:MAG: DUF1566 domain-containing protein [Deltaproteobacteria bacterium]|nr:DUF1566 domain-containing protein [Deltaproteobacteria bacterium]